ncbi:MAG: site-2 protease family protein [Verrucomicrobiota bacterium]|jgi:Zn-dependent protease
MPTRQGSIRLFRLFGIDVYLHWLWFLAVVYFVNEAKGYTSPIWSVLECLALFLIVLIHEFGHQLACRQVGGKTSDIILWPLGGVAYVSPPQRPGAQLWSIAAGPLVNVILFPILSALALLGGHLGWVDTSSNLTKFLNNIWSINLVLLIFNMLPIYPLDGGQILRSLLWFVFGRANSLLAVSIIGFIGVAVLIGMAVLLLFFSTEPTQGIWLGILCVFILMNCWGGLMQARALSKIAKIPRRAGFACPNCKTPPPQGAFWVCGKCRKPFDTFQTQGVCPNCGVRYSATSCPECGSLRPFNEWIASGNVPPLMQ